MNQALFALPHDGTLRGDNFFCPSSGEAIPYTEGDSFEDLKASYKKMTFDRISLEYPDGNPDTELDEESERGIDENLKGFWIVDMKILQAMDAISNITIDDMEACYAIDKAIKAVVNHFAIRTLGQPIS